MKSNLTILLILILVYSCSEKKKAIPIKWDFMNSSFNDVRFGNSNLGMLCMYDVVELKKINDSVIVLNLEIFKGWNEKWLPYSDTLKLDKSIFETDSIGNTKQQMLSFSNSKKTNFELAITQNPGLNDSIKFYDYRGKLSIKTDTVDYFCEELYVK